MKTVEISSESWAKILEINGLKYYKQYEPDWIINRAMEKYYERVMDGRSYSLFRKVVTKKRLSNQGWKCYYCEQPLAIEDATLDHLTPIIRGGLSDGSNLVVACGGCNLSKGDATEGEYRTFSVTLLKAEEIIRKYHEQGTAKIRSGYSGPKTQRTKDDSPSPEELASTLVDNTHVDYPTSVV
jgi:5-methylcytosine-specific restriction endonuclease McrA